MRAHFAVGLSLFVLAACHESRVKEGELLLDHGEINKASVVADEEVQKHPNDKDAHLLLAHVYMRQCRADDAARALKPIADDPEMMPRIAADYANAATLAAGKPDMSEAMVRFALAAAQFDPARQKESCQTLLRSLRLQDANWRGVARAAASLNADCRADTVHVLHARITNATVTYPMIQQLEAMAVTAQEIDPATANDFAHALRDLAKATLPSNRGFATMLLDSAMRVDPSIRGEAETFNLRNSMYAVFAMPSDSQQAAMLAHPELGDPLGQTKRLMQQIGTVIAQYVAAHDRAPLASNLDELERALKPFLRGALPRKDGWGTPFEYVCAPNSKDSRLISAGADRVISSMSRRLNGPALGKVDDAGADLISANGVLIQEPNPDLILSDDRPRL